MKSTVLILCCALICACTANQGNERQSRLPTDAEVEAYNAQVPPEERIVCRQETPVGTYIPKRVCRLQADMEETSDLHRGQLRRVLQ